MITINTNIVSTIEGLSRAELVTLINDLEDTTTDIDVILNKLSNGSYDVNNDGISIYDKLNTLEGDVSSIKKKIDYSKGKSNDCKMNRKNNNQIFYEKN